MEVYSQERALAAADGDRELVQELLAMFRESSDEMIREVEDAVQAGSADQLRIAAHTLKGALANLGALAAADVARQLESMGAAGDISRAGSACRSLIAEIERFQQVTNPEGKISAG